MKQPLRIHISELINLLRDVDDELNNFVEGEDQPDTIVALRKRVNSYRQQMEAATGRMKG